MNLVSEEYMGFGKKDTQTVKGVAILLLLFYHLFSKIDVYSSFDVKFLLEHSTVVLLSSFANICVAIFLFLSAYGITISLIKIPDDKLTINRVSKLTVNRISVLILHFLAMYVGIWLIWFTKLDYFTVYGEGKQSIIFAITDALGLAEIFDTPTMCMTWWYMEIAILCIALVPLFQFLYKKIGAVIIIILLLLPNLVVMDLDVFTYVVVIAFGLCAANGKWIEKLKTWNTPYLMKVCLSLVALTLSFFLRMNFVVQDHFGYAIEGLIAFVWVVSIYIIFEKIPVITSSLRFFGKHSMNIFFFHTFIYLLLYRNQLYSLRYSILIFITLLGISTLFSIVIEFIKEKFGFYKLVKKVKGDL
jgi:hypothetical protein